MPKIRDIPPKSKDSRLGPVSTVDLAIGLGLILGIFAVYSQVGSFYFTTYDDNLFVTENVHVQSGLNLDSIRWAMTAVVASNWMPLTVLSHMLDCQLFGEQSGMHHLVNVLFHMLASLMVFVWLKRATGARWPSAWVAMMFAVHPLHVESVAWIAERKDVLSACFWFLGLYAYVRYAQRPSERGYLAVVLIFCLGLAAKPMLVTFPFVLLLLDVWPLRRFQFPRVLLEKLPMLALAAAVSVVTYSVQRVTAVFQAFPLPVRIENTLISYVAYIGQLFWPAGLAVLYPYRESPPVWEAAVAGVLLLAVTAAVVLAWRTRPYLAVGWFWYLGTLVPVIGLVQVGLQERADRYMYIPMVGLLTMLAWGSVEILSKWPAAKLSLLTAAVVSTVACITVARVQTDYWQNSETLFDRALAVTQQNYVAEYNLGNYLMNTRRGTDAIPHYLAAIHWKPNYAEAHCNLGMVLGGLPGHMSEAIARFETAIRINPKLLPAQYNLAVALEQTGKKSEALQHYEIVQRLQPSPELARIIKRLRTEVTQPSQ